MKHPQWVVPQEDTRILNWFGDAFESVFVLLHPFVAAPEELRPSFESDNGPLRAEVRRARRVTWLHMTRLVHFKDICHLNRVLLAWRNSVDVDEVSVLLDSVAAERLLLPEEGEIPYMLLDGILRTFQKCGFETVLVGDEFGERANPFPVEGLLELAYPVLPEAHARLIAPDRSTLIAPHWDLFSSFVCGRSATIESLVESCDLEGFFCNEDTRVYWHEQDLEEIAAEDAWRFGNPQ